MAAGLQSGAGAGQIHRCFAKAACKHVLSALGGGGTRPLSRKPGYAVGVVSWNPWDLLLRDCGVYAGTRCGLDEPGPNTRDLSTDLIIHQIATSKIIWTTAPMIQATARARC